jgi:hypothetical protein
MPETILVHGVCITSWCSAYREEWDIWAEETQDAIMVSEDDMNCPSCDMPGKLKGHDKLA